MKGSVRARAPLNPPPGLGLRLPSGAFISSLMRAERAKLKSRRDGMKIAQGKRGTSAALGEWQKQKPLPLSWFGARRRAKPGQRKTG